MGASVISAGRRRFADRLRAVVLVACIAGLAASMVPVAHAAEPNTSNVSGEFFAAGSTDRGFAVTDHGGARLWSSWRDLGGVQTIGAPVSRRFQLGGNLAQVFERGVLRWDAGGVSVVNALDLLAARGYNERLRSDFGIPASADWSGDAGQDWPTVSAPPHVAAGRIRTLAVSTAPGLSYGGANRWPATRRQSCCTVCLWRSPRRMPAMPCGPSGRPGFTTQTWTTHRGGWISPAF